MAAYWRSPYREYSNSFRSPDNSTLKFEQSLYLSRSRTSINSAKYDWLDAAFAASPSSPHSHRQPDLTRSNTNIKSILKPPRRNINIFRGKQTDSNSSGESNNDTAAEPSSNNNNNVKKRVTFGFSKDFEDENDQRDSRYLQNKKFQLKTMKRLSHSRLLEESAMKKLNRLIGGGGAAAPFVESTSLPSVKGTGILSPRHSAADNRVPKSACSHSGDLRCIRCIRKDVETGHEDRIYGKANVKERPIPKPNSSLNSRDHVIDNEIDNFTQRLEGDVVTDWLTPDQMCKDNAENINYDNTLPHYDREESAYPTGNSSTISGSNSLRKHIRLLPGRYPFMTGSMQIKKLSIPDIQRAQRGDAPVTPENTNLVDLKYEKTATKQILDKHNNDLSQRINPSGATTTNKNTRSSSATNKIPSISRGVTRSEGGNNENGAIKSSKGDNNENGYNDSDDENDTRKQRKLSSDKTSDILDWLNDVHKKRKFKSRSSLNNTSES